MPEGGDAAIDAAEWAQVSGQRALVYGWFATLYAAEVPNPMLTAYLAGEAAPLFDGLTALGLGDEVTRLEAAIDALGTVADAHLELAADFAQMFLLDAKAGALPYASAYGAEQTRLVRAGRGGMRAFLADASLAIQDDFKEPADHLAIYLAVMQRLITQHASTLDAASAASDQAAFLDDAVRGWLPDFVARNQRVSPQYDFYPALAALLLAFIEDDAQFIREVAQPSLTAMAP